MQKYNKKKLNEDGVFIASHLRTSTVKGSVFAQLIPDAETRDRLQMFCDLNDITQKLDFSGLPAKREFHYHMTIVYSKDEDSIINPGEIDLGIIGRSIELNVNSFDMLGPENDVPVLMMSETDAYTSRMKFLSDMMLTNFRIPPSKFPFKPHVSLSYDRVPVKTNTQLFEQSFARMRKKPLVFDKFVVERKKM